MPPDHDVPGLSEALKELESSLHTDPSSRNVIRVAEGMRLEGRSDRAVALLEPLLEREPTRISPWVLLAWCLEDLGNVARAQDVLDQVRSLDPGNPFARSVEPPRAELPFGTSPFVEVEPDGAPAPEPLAEPLAEPERSAEPLPEPEPAQPAAPDPEMEAEPERSLTQRELRDMPPNPLYSATLAEIFEKQGFEEKAIEIYEEVVRLHPERNDLHARIAQLRRCAPEDAAS